MMPAIRVNHESASWENMSSESRTAVARAAGYVNEFQLIRIANSGWSLLPYPEQIAIFRVNWRAVISAQVDTKA
jgi:hypothetical protein